MAVSIQQLPSLSSTPNDARVSRTEPPTSTVRLATSTKSISIRARIGTGMCFRCQRTATCGFAHPSIGAPLWSCRSLVLFKTKCFRVLILSGYSSNDTKQTSFGRLEGWILHRLVLQPLRTKTRKKMRMRWIRKWPEMHRLPLRRNTGMLHNPMPMPMPMW